MYHIIALPTSFPRHLAVLPTSLPTLTQDTEIIALSIVLAIIFVICISFLALFQRRAALKHQVIRKAQRTLDSLRRTEEQTQTIERLKVKIEALELEASNRRLEAHRIQHAQDQQISNVLRANSELKATATRLDVAVSRQTQELAQKDRIIVAREDKITQLKFEVDVVTKDLDSAEAQIDRLKQRFAQYGEELIDAASQCNIRDADRLELKGRLGQYLASLEELDAHIKELEAQLAESAVAKVNTEVAEIAENAPRVLDSAVHNASEACLAHTTAQSLTTIANFESRPLPTNSSPTAEPAATITTLPAASLTTRSCPQLPSRIPRLKSLHMPCTTTSTSRSLIPTVRKVAKENVPPPSTRSAPGVSKSAPSLSKPLRSMATTSGPTTYNTLSPRRCNCLPRTRPAVPSSLSAATSSRSAATSSRSVVTSSRPPLAPISSTSRNTS